MTRRFVVTGINGQVVQALIERSAVRSDVEIFAVGRPVLDLSRLETIEPALRAAKPAAIVSAAAYTAVDQAETDEATAFQVNGAAVGEIARVARAMGVPVLHLSTDYVFDGEKPSPYQETDGVNPIGVYGRSKLEGENQLTASGADHVILRTAWVYSPFGKNFLRTILRLASERDTLKIVADQRGNPTSALDIADGVLNVIDHLLASPVSELRGVLHLAGSGEASWAEFASEILAQSVALGGPTARVEPITTAEFPTPARRPKNSRLDCSRLQRVHGLTIPIWQESLSKVIRRLLPAKN